MLNEVLTYRKKRKIKSHQTLIKRFKSTTTIPNLTCLPNELFYQIFSYLTDGELLLSFKNFIRTDRFNELIRNRTSINFYSIRREQFFENKCFINSRILHQIYLFNRTIK